MAASQHLRRLGLDKERVVISSVSEIEGGDCWNFRGFCAITGWVLDIPDFGDGREDAETDETVLARSRPQRKVGRVAKSAEATSTMKLSAPIWSLQNFTLGLASWALSSVTSRRA